MRFVQSPYHSSRGNYQITGVVIHTVVGSYTSCVNYFQNNSRRVSAHYVVKEDGSEITQMVKEDRAAHHAGLVKDPTTPVYRGNNPNFYTIGIENADGGNPHGSDRTGQYPALAKLVKEICERNNIPIDRDHICGHREIYSAKTCPGNIDVDYVVALAKGGSVPPNGEEEKRYVEGLGEVTFGKLIEEYGMEKERVTGARQERDNALAENERLRGEFEKLKEDAKREKESLQARNDEEKKRYRAFLSSLAGKLGTPQDEPKILEAITTLIGKEDKIDYLERAVKERDDTILDLKKKLSAFENDDPLSAYSATELILIGFRKLFGSK